MDQTSATTDRPQRKLRVLDVLFILAILVVCLALVQTLVHQLAIRHEVSAATAISSQVVEGIRKQDGSAVRRLGNTTFQRENSAANLTAQFKAASKFTAKPAVIDRRTVTNSSVAQAVSVIYKFPSKPALFVRVIIVNPHDTGNWQLVNLNANIDEQSLLDNKY